MQITKWDMRFLSLVDNISTWSKDPSTKVGAVLVDAYNRIVSCGYNGFPRSVRDEAAALDNRPMRLKRTIHAEANCLLFAPGRTDAAFSATLYVSRPACAQCTALALQLTVTRIVASYDADFMTRWADDVREAHRLCEEAHVMYDLAERCGTTWLERPMKIDFGPR
jgi:dCMP deaminase